MIGCWKCKLNVDWLLLLDTTDVSDIYIPCLMLSFSQMWITLRTVCGYAGLWCREKVTNAGVQLTDFRLNDP